MDRHRSAFGVGVFLVPIVYSHNLSWMNGWVGGTWLLSVAAGVFVGLFGGVSLAIARKNPLWLAPSILSFCVAFAAVVLITAMGMAQMH
ncbi:MAG: hypothetical protein ABI748_06210 [Dokdonella sp.]